MNNKSRSNESVCEKSVKLMTNIVKASYISIAKFGFRTHATPPSLARATHNPAPSFPARYPRNLRSHEPSVCYLMHPGDKNRSNKRMIKDDGESVDKEAWDFIKKVHAKNLKDASDEMTNLHEFVLPPPPHIMTNLHAKNLKDASDEMTNLHEFVLPPPPHIMLQPSSSSYY